jgi:hypothetical protein
MKTPAFKITLTEEAPAGMRGVDNHPTYRVRVNGTPTKHLLFFNMTGYAGYLPTPDGFVEDIGERPLSAFKKAISRLNREASSMNPASIIIRN